MATSPLDPLEPPHHPSLAGTMVVGLKEEESLSTILNAKVVGHGNTTVVLAHGYCADQTIWDKVLPELSSLCRVVLFDWSFSGSVERVTGRSGKIGGFSYEELAEELLFLGDEMGLGDVVYVGHSMAAMIGCLASLRRPDFIRHLVLLGGSPRYMNSEDYHGGFSPEDIEAIFSNIELNFEQWLGAFAAAAVGPHDLESAEKFGGLLRKMKPETALSLAKIIFSGDYRCVLEKIETPCTIIQCSDDFVVPMTVVEYMKKKMKAKTTTVEIIENNGHFPQLTVPSLFLDILKRVVAFD